MNEILNILSTDLFRKIVNSKCMQISQLNSVVSLLIKAGIQFTLSFTPETSTEEAIARLTINIRPGLSITIDVEFDAGEMFL